MPRRQPAAPAVPDLPAVHRAPWRFRPRWRDRRGPFPHHVPAGPPTDTAAAVEASLAHAEERAHDDMAAGIHDAVSLAHDQRLLFEHEVEARGTRELARSVALERGDLMMGEQIRARAEQRAACADAALAEVEAAVTAAEAVLQDSEAELRGHPPYESSPWRAPERAAETPRQTFVKVWGVLMLLVPAELSINVLAFQLVPGDSSERLSFALVVGLATIWAGHTAGVWIRERVGAPARVRWTVPALLAVLVVTVTALVASFRLAYIDQPGALDTITDVRAPSPLDLAGLPKPLFWVGIAAVQLVFFVVTVLHTAHVHNPHVRAMHTARARRRRLARRLRSVRREQAEAAAAQRLATSPDHTAHLWAAHRLELHAGTQQAVARYLEQLARELHDPDATVALEARLARSTAADGALAATPRPEITAVPAERDTDTDTAA